MQIISRRSGLFLGCIIGGCIMLLITPLSSHGQFVYDPTTNTYQFLGEPFGGDSDTTTTTNTTTEHQAADGNDSTEASVVSVDPITMDSGQFANSIQQALDNVQLTHIPELLEQLKQITKAWFNAVDQAEKDLLQRFADGVGVLQQRSLLACLEMVPWRTSLSVEDQFSRLRSNLLDRLSNVVGELLSFDQKRNIWAIATWDVEDQLWQRELVAMIELFEETIEVLLTSRQENILAALHDQENTLRDAFANTNIDIDQLIERYNRIQDIEGAYSTMLRTFAAHDDRVEERIRSFNLLGQATVRFYTEQYMHLLERERRAFTQLDSIGLHAIQETYQAKLQAVQQKIRQQSQTILDQHYPASRLDAITQELTTLRNTYAPRWIIACNALVQDDAIDAIAPRLLNMIRVAQQDAEFSTTLVQTAERDRAKATYLEAMRTFMDNDILRTQYRQDVADLTRLVQEYGGLVVFGSRNTSPSAYDQVVRILTQQYLQFAAQERRTEYRALFARAEERLQIMFEHSTTQQAALLWVIGDAMDYVKRNYIEAQ